MISCDYCKYEKECSARSSYINFAEEGCPGYRHADDLPISEKKFEDKKEEINNFLKDFI